MKVAIFDFDKTLVNLQTLNKFVEFVILNSERKLPSYKIIIKKVLLRCRKLFIKIFIKPRYLEIFLLKGFTRKFLSGLAIKFFEEVIINSQNKVIIKELLRLKEEGYTIIILSAALDIYLNYIKKILPVDYIICSELDFKDGVCSGKIKSIDTFGDGKLEKLMREFPDYDKIDWNKSYYFTDDYITELNILKKVGHPVIVSEKNRQVKIREINAEVIYV